MCLLKTRLLKHEPYMPWVQFSHDTLSSAVGEAWTSVPGRVRNHKISHERPPAPRAEGGIQLGNTETPLLPQSCPQPGPAPPASPASLLAVATTPPPLIGCCGKLAAAVKPSMTGGGWWWRWWWQPCERGVGEPSPCGALCARRHCEQLPLLARQANSPGVLGP